MRTPDRETRLCLSISARPGNFGTRFQNFLYEALDLNFVYLARATEDLAGAIHGIRALGIRGAAISMPFKEACIPLLDHLDPAARSIGAVNTIVNEGGILTGYNTDWISVRQRLRELSLSTETPFVLRGSGGMARAMLHALRVSGFRKGCVISRNPRTREELAQRFGIEWRQERKALEGRPPEGALLIQATPIGMSGGQEASDLAFPPAWIKASAAVMDAVGFPSDTPLIQAARSLGKPVITGGDLLIPQAVEQFRLYTGIVPDAERVARAAQVARG